MSTNAQQPTTVHISPSSVSFAALSPSALTTFINQLLGTPFWQNVQMLFENPIDNVISIRHYPFNPPMISFNYPSESDIVTAQSMVVNDVTINVTNALMSNTAPKLLNLGGIQIPVGDSFLDYAPYTKYELFIPFMGFVMLDTDAITGKYLNVQYAVDFNTGIATAYIQVKPSNASPDSSYVIIDMKEAKVGVDIPVCGGSSAEISKAMLTTGINAATGGVSLVGNALESGIKGQRDYMGAAESAVNYAASTSVSAIAAGQQHIIKGQVGNGYNSLYAPTNMYLIKTQVKYDIPTSYNKMYGRPVRYTYDMDEISTGSGLVTVEQCHLDGFTTATQNEISMIAQALKEGVIL